MIILLRVHKMEEQSKKKAQKIFHAIIVKYSDYFIMHLNLYLPAT